MGRSEKRAIARQQAEANKAQKLWNEKHALMQKQQIIDDAIEEAVEITKNHYLGEMYTMVALVLRQPPYRWPVAKVMRLLERIQSGVMSLNNDTYTTQQLIEDTEAWGIRVKWSKGPRKYITEVYPFEEEVNEEG